MKFECKCGNTIAKEHGYYDKCKEGIRYLLFCCTECKSMIKVEKDGISSDAVYNYTLEKSPIYF